MLQGHYHSPNDFTEEALNSAKTGYERLKNSINSLKQTLRKNDGKASKEKFNDIEQLKDQFLAAMEDDFNTPQAIAVLFDILKISNNEISSENPSINKLKYIDSVIESFLSEILGLKIQNAIIDNNTENKLMDFIIELRNNFRKEKNFKASDEIRDKLLTFGITLKDGPDGTKYTK
jgi:cysteinyl-tRNA synthetase